MLNIQGNKAKAAALLMTGFLTACQGNMKDLETKLEQHGIDMPKTVTLTSPSSHKGTATIKRISTGVFNVILPKDKQCPIRLSTYNMPEGSNKLTLRGRYMAEECCRLPEHFKGAVSFGGKTLKADLYASISCHSDGGGNDNNSASGPGPSGPGPSDSGPGDIGGGLDF